MILALCTAVTFFLPLSLAYLNANSVRKAIRGNLKGGSGCSKDVSARST